MRYSKYLTPQNLLAAAAALGAYVVMRKINKGIDWTKNTFSAQNAERSVVEGSKAAALQMGNNPITQGILTWIGTNAAKKAKPAEPITKPVFDSTPERIKRAKMLLAEFTVKKHLRVRVKQAVNASVVQFDTFGAVIDTGAKKFIKTGETIERGNGFIKTTTGKGFLVLSDVVNKKFYTINPHIVTLV